MIGSLTGFARALRAAGVPLSPAEVIDSAIAVRAAGLEDPETFRLALRASVIKSVEHQPLFDQLYPAWFSVPWPAGPDQRRGHKQHAPSPGERGRQTGGIGEGRGRKPSLDPCEGRDQTADEQGLRGDDPRPAELDRHRAEAAELRQQAGLEQRQAQARARRQAQRQAADRPALRPLRERFDDHDLRQLERETERLGRLLRTRQGRRYQRASRGRIDLRSTIALGVRTGGVPCRLMRHTRRIARPRLLVLCDVSGSAIRTARFLLRLLHETHRLFDRTAGFVFVDRPVSAAPLFRHHDFDATLAALDDLPGLDLHALSDFGNLFERLLAQHHELLTPSTSLLVLGDARCNRFDPQVWALESVARRVAQVFWLNPERRERWETGDSRLREYRPWIDQLLPAETLADLADGLDQLCRSTTAHRR